MPVNVKLKYVGRRTDSMFKHNGLVFDAILTEEINPGLAYSGKFYVTDESSVAYQVFKCGVGSSWYAMAKGRQWFEILSVEQEDISCL